MPDDTRIRPPAKQAAIYRCQICQCVFAAAPDNSDIEEGPPRIVHHHCGPTRGVHPDVSGIRGLSVEVGYGSVRERAPGARAAGNAGGL